MNDLAHLDPRTRDALARAVSALESRLGSDLLGAVLYGSATGSDFLPGRSDLNVLVLLTRVRLAALEAARDVARRWRRHRVRPLLMTPADLRSSLDVFPIELAEIQSSRVVLYGEDPFRDLAIRPAHLRLQCEAEVKRHLIMFRNAVVAGGTGRALEALLARSITGLLPVLRTLLRLLGGSGPPPGRDEAVARVAERTGIDPAPLREALALKRGERRPTAILRSLAEAYLLQLERLVEAVDRLKTGPEPA